MISYAAVYLSDSNQTEPGKWIDREIDPASLFPLAQRFWPGTLTSPVLEQTAWPCRPVTIGSWYWPWGASRFSQAHFVVGEAQLAQIRRNVVYPDGLYKPSVLRMDDGSSFASAYMYMLPARPLSTAAAGSGMYLLSLVDERYFWWEKQLTMTVVEDVTAWTDLYAAIGSTLGVTITVDPIASAYLTPATDYATATLPLPLAFDTLAFSVGQRVVRGRDGAVKAQNFRTAQAQVAANLAAGFTPSAGGSFALDARVP